MTKLLCVMFKTGKNTERRYIVIVDLFRWYPSWNSMGGSPATAPLLTRERAII
ncbi:MAG TPA: hypothetical protein VNZ53_14080 [Steroidobacteraceae bacterium]|jgi:hypothetical protein|nr:hypothetical protein [Steroidobacteraceae bacterium]